MYFCSAMSNAGCFLLQQCDFHVGRIGVRVLTVQREMNIYMTDAHRPRKC